jgi:hypothetical protein
VEEALRERQERAARNQSMWREINELALTKRQDNPTFSSFVCECADETCVEEVSLTREEYEAVRSRSNHFFVKPSHVLPNVERVIEDAGGDGARYQVVEKFAKAGLVAAERDPRAAS